MPGRAVETMTRARVAATMIATRARPITIATRGRVAAMTRTIRDRAEATTTEAARPWVRQRPPASEAMPTTEAVLPRPRFPAHPATGQHPAPPAETETGMVTATTAEIGAAQTATNSR